MVVKFNPSIASNVKLNNVTNSLLKLKPIKQIPAPEKIIGLAAMGATGIAIGSFFKDFNKTVQDNYFQLKIDENTGMPYEADVFQKAAAMNLYLGNDVLVTAPTGTGKTAIAHYVITKNMKEGGRTFYTTPLKALSNEKYRDFCKTYGRENVGLLTGDTKLNPDAPVVIMTTEVYRNMSSARLFNNSIDDRNNMHDLKTVIFDELQYLGDIDRGGIWEQSIMFTPSNVQLLSLSATIGNNEEINNWMASIKGRKGIAVTPEGTYRPRFRDTKDTVLINVPSENRHVPLSFEKESVTAFLKKSNSNSRKKKTYINQRNAAEAESIYAKPTYESFVKLTEKLNTTGKLPAIYFVFSKDASTKILEILKKDAPILTSRDERNEITRIIEQKRNEGEYLGESLDFDALMHGYTIHNAGLLPSQKALVEELFQKKLVKVVIATETLSAGINMPAKTTVISSPRKPTSTPDGGPDGKRNLTANEFHQMAGRAGRRGIDTHGYAYAMKSNFEQSKLYDELINSSANALESNLELDYAFIMSYLSEFGDMSALRQILSKSLYTYDSEKGANNKKVKEIMNNFFIKREILRNNKFMDDNGITTKGELIKVLNGYEQIPIINLLADKTFANLNPIQIAGLVGGLANIEYNTIGSERRKKVEEVLAINPSERAYAQAYDEVENEINNYAIYYEKLYPGKRIKFKPNVVGHLKEWADLNAENEDSRKNWRKLYRGEMSGTIRDEGSLFKEIMMTADLLKQLIEVAQAGAKYSKSYNDIEYYMAMELKFKQALDFIQREPAVG